MAKKLEKIYQLEIWLNDITPRIWRTFEVDSAIRLDQLHEVIQDVMGWTDTHLHSFTIGRDEYGMLLPDEDAYNEGMRDERKYRLSDLVSRPKDRFDYMYDFGDGWEHILELVEIKEPQAGVKYPVCVAGERACPPEDCGGLWGYPEFLEAIRDPDHEDHEEMLEWAGGEFDAEAFDVKEVNELLR